MRRLAIYDLSMPNLCRAMPDEHTRLIASIAAMPREAFRQSAHDVVDWMADYLEGLEQHPVVPFDLAPGDIQNQLASLLGDAPMPIEDLLDTFRQTIVPGLTHWNHPGFMAYFTSNSSGPGILGEMIAAALNVNTMLWRTGPAATELEAAVLDALRGWLGLPTAYWGMLHEGGSASNLHALVAARAQALGPTLRDDGLYNQPHLRIYVTEHTHSSIDRAVIALGLGLRSLHRIPVDAGYRMRPDALVDAIARDRAAGYQPCCVVGTAGTTAATTIDPLDQLAEVCAQENLWLHVDAAHGGALALLDDARHQLHGWERAASITFNPHKWLFVPLDCSVLYTRHPNALRQAFRHVPAYLETTAEPLNYMDYGLALGRRFRALKLWFVLAYFGREGLATRIREHLRLARWFADQIDAHPAFERMAPVPMSTVCFRACLPALHDPERLDAFNERLLDAVNRTGDVFLSHARLEGRFVLRLVVSGLRVEARHIRQAWKLLPQTFAEQQANGKST